jgi:hypothetical protein
VKNLLNIKPATVIKRARHSLALLMFMFLPLYFFAQQTYFEKRYDFHNNYDRAQNILSVDSGYIMAGITQDRLYIYNYHLSITKLSLTGDIVNHKEYGYDSINILTGNPGSFIKRGDKFYLFGSYWVYTDDWVHESGYFSCYNNNLDTIWTRKYGEKSYPFDTSYFAGQMKQINCQDFILIGSRMPKGVHSRIWLLKTDSLGNKLGERFYGEGNEYFQGHSVVQTNDGGYVIGGYKFVIGYLDTGDPLIIKTDSLGNEEWRLNPGNTDVSDNKVMVALAQDGNIIAGTNYGTEQSGDNRWAVVKIMKITPGGTVLWDYNYLEPQYDNFLLNTIVLNNSNILVNGARNTHSQGQEYPWKMGWILCTDSAGNQLWYKEYALLTGHNSFNDLYDVRETEDGGLIGVGKADPLVPDTGTADIWIMKMDSMGCLWEGCDTTVIINNTVSSNNGFVVYPVPATNRLTVKLPEEAGKGTLFTVYNMLGLKTKSVTIPYRNRTKNLNIAGLPSGVYLGVLSVNGKVTGKRKFIIRK